MVLSTFFLYAKSSGSVTARISEPKPPRSLAMLEPLPLSLGLERNFGGTRLSLNAFLTTGEFFAFEAMPNRRFLQPSGRSTSVIMGRIRFG